MPNLPPSTQKATRRGIPVQRDPALNPQLHPEKNPRINPHWNKALDPTINASINPYLRVGLNPVEGKGLRKSAHLAVACRAGVACRLLTEWCDETGKAAEEEEARATGYFVWNLAGALKYATAPCLPECHRVFSAAGNHVGVLISNGAGGFNLFGLDGIWVGYWVPNGEGGFVCFTTGGIWSHFTT